MKWKLQVDCRERKSRLFELVGQDEEFDVHVELLRAGDYIVNDGIVLERKSHADFAKSIIDGRLFHQAALLKELRLRCLFLVEGPKPEIMPRMHPHALKGAILSLAVSWRIPVVFSRTPEESVAVLCMLAEQSQTIKQVNSFRPGQRLNERERQRTFLLQGLPGVGARLAADLLEHFGSVENIVRASGAELEKVPGCGPKRAAAIRRVLSDEGTELKS